MVWHRPFSRQFPFELQEAIALIAVQDDRSTAIRIVLVARRYYEWIQPKIYENLSLAGYQQASRFAAGGRSIKQHPPSLGCVKRDVKNLEIQGIFGDQLEAILRRARGVQRASIRTTWCQGHHLQPALSLLDGSLKHARIDLAQLVLYRPLTLSKGLASVTHLNMGRFRVAARDRTFQALDALPALTHLCGALTTRECRAILAQLPRLSVLCQLVYYRGPYDAQDDCSPNSVFFNGEELGSLDVEFRDDHIFHSGDVAAKHLKDKRFVRLHAENYNSMLSDEEWEKVEGEVKRRTTGDWAPFTRSAEFEDWRKENPECEKGENWRIWKQGESDDSE